MNMAKNIVQLKTFKLASLFVFIFLLDQVTKYWFSRNLILAINTGFSFGLINNLSIMVISALQIFFLVVVVFFAKFRKIGQYQAVIILAAGSSNLLDRWLFSGVRDIFYLPILNLTNNLADWLIFLTIIFGILTKLKQEHQ